MRIVVDRFVSDTDTTVSRLSVDGAFVCFGLEDEFREDKIANETRIPAGTYDVRLRTEGGHHERYAVRFPDFHRGMLHLQNVPKFEFILIHCGNTDEDTSGCLLVGSQALTEPGEMRVTQSGAAYGRLYTMVVGAAAARDLTIEIQDNDRVAAPAALPAPAPAPVPPRAAPPAPPQAAALSASPEPPAAPARPARRAAGRSRPKPAPARAKRKRRRPR